VDATNELLVYRETLNREQQDLLDEDQVRSTAQILLISRHRQLNTTIPRQLPALIPTTWNRHAKSHDKVAKRLMTGAEAAVKDADKQEKQEATEMKQKEEQQRLAEEAVRVKESTVDDELLGGMALDHDDSDNSSHTSSTVTEVIFTTPISPP
jgi:hypothetical protein